MGRRREWLVAHGKTEPSAEEAAAFEALCERRHAGEPVAYLLGNTQFYGREFVVNDRVMVPRPETEHLVDEALRFIRGPMHVLDVGTGCGAIACTIAAETNAVIDATDNSRAAVEIATQNARRLGLLDHVRFHHGDLAEPVRKRRFDVIIANLPYVPAPDLPRRPDPASFEPRQALYGGPDGLVHYRRLLPQLPCLLNEGALLLLEAAPPTIHRLMQLVRSSFPYFVIDECTDYARLPRYIRASSRALGICCGAVPPRT